MPRVLEVLREHKKLREEVSRLRTLYEQVSTRYSDLLDFSKSNEANRPSAWIQREAKYRWGDCFGVVSGALVPLV